MNKEGRSALAKVRTYCYILFMCYAVMLFHYGLSNLFKVSVTRVQYGLIAIIAVQIIMCIMYVVKFATTVQGGKKKDVNMMIAARVRVFFLIQALFLAVQAVNASVMESKLIDYGCTVVNILNMIMVLQNLTILQRQNFTGDMIDEASGKAMEEKKKKAAAATKDEKTETYKKKNKSNKSKKNYRVHMDRKAELESARAADEQEKLDKLKSLK